MPRRPPTDSVPSAYFLTRPLTSSVERCARRAAYPLDHVEGPVLQDRSCRDSRLVPSAYRPTATRNPRSTKNLAERLITPERSAGRAELLPRNSLAFPSSLTGSHIRVAQKPFHQSALIPYRARPSVLASRRLLFLLRHLRRSTSASFPLGLCFRGRWRSGTALWVRWRIREHP